MWNLWWTIFIIIIILLRFPHCTSCSSSVVDKVCTIATGIPRGCASPHAGNYCILINDCTATPRPDKRRVWTQKLVTILWLLGPVAHLRQRMDEEKAKGLVVTQYKTRRVLVTIPVSSLYKSSIMQGSLTRNHDHCGEKYLKQNNKNV